MGGRASHSYQRRLAGPAGSTVRLRSSQQSETVKTDEPIIKPPRLPGQIAQGLFQISTTSPARLLTTMSDVPDSKPRLKLRYRVAVHTQAQLVMHFTLSCSLLERRASPPVCRCSTASNLGSIRPVALCCHTAQLQWESTILVLYSVLFDLLLIRKREL